MVLRRHAALGDHVEKGQALVTLFSETVAQAQASYRVASYFFRRGVKVTTSPIVIVLEKIYR